MSGQPELRDQTCERCGNPLRECPCPARCVSCAVATELREEIERLKARRPTKAKVMAVIDEIIAEQEQAEAERDRLREAEKRVRELAQQWAALSPPDDYSDTFQDAITADAGRAILAALDQPEDQSGSVVNRTIEEALDIIDGQFAEDREPDQPEDQLEAP